MSTSKIILLMGCFCFYLQSQAQESMGACSSLKELDAKSDECADNKNYLDAGKSCVRMFETVVSNITKVPIDELAKTADKSKKISKAQSEQIFTDAKKVKSILSAYRDNIFFPEDWDAPEEVIGEADKFLYSHRCYSQANEGLRKMEENIDSYVKEFGPQKVAKEAKKNK
jgi:hypothetical protein